MTRPTQPKASKPQTKTTFADVERSATVIPNFDEFSDSAMVRQAQLVRDPNHPERPTPLPFSPATFWRKVKDGSFPKPVKLGERITCWRVGDVRAWLAAQAAP